MGSGFAVDVIEGMFGGQKIAHCWPWQRPPAINQISNPLKIFEKQTKPFPKVWENSPEMLSN